MGRHRSDLLLLADRAVGGKSGIVAFHRSRAAVAKLARGAEPDEHVGWHRADLCGIDYSVCLGKRAAPKDAALTEP